MKYLCHFGSVFFIASLFLCGCYSYGSLSSEEQREKSPSDDDAILIILNDGTVIESDSYNHIFTKEPTDAIFGIGQKRSSPHPETARSGDPSIRTSRFRGSLKASEIRSSQKYSRTEGEALQDCGVSEKRLFRRITRVQPNSKGLCRWTRSGPSKLRGSTFLRQAAWSSSPHR